MPRAEDAAADDAATITDCASLAALPSAATPAALLAVVRPLPKLTPEHRGALLDSLPEHERAAVKALVEDATDEDTKPGT